jgi:flavin reductase (DIM6/NTAB) family NADH-FMN oxidoreductase RutF/rubredoxin
MNQKALFDITYGIFMLSTTFEGRVNGCITNTCMQVANDPCRIAISCLNKNYTCELIKQSGRFNLSILDKTAPFDLIKQYGMQSGRDADKLKKYLLKDLEGMPYLDQHACAVISAVVADSLDLGTHTLFIAEVKDALLLNEEAPLTYDWYQNHIKPKPAVKPAEKKIVGWRCRICGYIYDKPDLPEDFICPWCGHGADDFEPVYD